MQAGATKRGLRRDFGPRELGDIFEEARQVPVGGDEGSSLEAHRIENRIVFGQEAPSAEAIERRAKSAVAALLTLYPERVNSAG